VQRRTVPVEDATERRRLLGGRGDELRVGHSR
jgi:hypothetical protein